MGEHPRNPDARLRAAPRAVVGGGHEDAGYGAVGDAADEAEKSPGHLESIYTRGGRLGRGAFGGSCSNHPFPQRYGCNSSYGQRMDDRGMCPPG